MQTKKASSSQIKMFFALSNSLGYGAEKIKNRAKEKFNLEHFPEITSPQINSLIEILLSKGVEK